MLFSSLTNVKQALDKAGLTADLGLPASFEPSVPVLVSYPGGKDVSHGNKLTVDDAKAAPELTLPPVDEGDAKAYTLVMVDPDVPSRANPIRRSFNHWVVTGMKAPSVSADTAEPPSLTAASASHTISYRPIGPPPGTKAHRYTFLLYEQPPSFSVQANDIGGGESFEGRKAFDVSKWADSKGLKLVGANYFEADPAGETS